LTSYVDATGFHRPTLQEIRKQIEAQFIVAIGAGVDLTATGPFGQIVANIATWADSLFALAQDAYTQQDPDQATGVFLDEACAKIGIYRLPATPAYVDDVVMWGTWGVPVTVPTGSKVKSATQPMSYSLQSDVELGSSSSGPFRSLRIATTGSWSTGDTFSIALNGVTYSYVTVSTDSAAEITAFAAVINAGAFGTVGDASLEVISSTNYLRIDGDSFTLGAYSIYLSPYQEAKAGTFVADLSQVQAVPPLTLDTILTPVSGWLAIEQPAAGLDGTDVETDASLRIRRIQGTRSGKGTEDAIREALYRVPGVSKAVVDSNRDDTPDSEGRDGHMIEAVVVGGNSADVAAAIWSTIGAGIAMYGATEVQVPGADGKTHPVKYSIPSPQYAWVKIASIVPDTDAGPAAGYQDAIRAAVVEFGNQQFGLGDNFNYQRMFAPVLSVPGIGSATITIAATATEGGTPTYVSANIPVASRDYLTFAPSRVVFV
jgi:uncharacterized phage protein gp47/JayE